MSGDPAASWHVPSEDCAPQRCFDYEGRNVWLSARGSRENGPWRLNSRLDDCILASSPRAGEDGFGPAMYRWFVSRSHGKPCWIRCTMRPTAVIPCTFDVAGCRNARRGSLLGETTHGRDWYTNCGLRSLVK